MKINDLLWPIFDITIVLFIIYAFDLKMYYGFLIILGYQILAGIISSLFHEKMPKGFSEAHLINFKKPEWWIFALWCLIAASLESR